MYSTLFRKMTPTGNRFMTIKTINQYTKIAYRWQARREGDRNMRAGLIPSRALQERRIIHERTQGEKEDEGKANMFCFVFAVALWLWHGLWFVNIGSMLFFVFYDVLHHQSTWVS